jgi:type IV pilus assembly protein PilV
MWHETILRCARAKCRTTPRAGEHGVALIEALITIVILAFGILGLAGLQAKMQAAEMESYQRTQALVLLEDMVHRVSANRANAATYVTVSPVGTGDAQPADCSGLAVGQPRDTCEWSNALKGAAEQIGGNSVGTVIGGRGCIEQVGGAVPPAFRVVVTWQGFNATAVPSFGCAANLYGSDDKLRRAIAKTVSVATLTPP